MAYRQHNAGTAYVEHTPEQTEDWLLKLNCFSHRTENRPEARANDHKMAHYLAVLVLSCSCTKKCEIRDTIRTFNSTNKHGEEARIFFAEAQG